MNELEILSLDIENELETMEKSLHETIINIFLEHDIKKTSYDKRVGYIDFVIDFVTFKYNFCLTFRDKEIACEIYQKSNNGYSGNHISTEKIYWKEKIFFNSKRDKLIAHKLENIKYFQKNKHRYNTLKKILHKFIPLNIKRDNKINDILNNESVSVN